MSAFAIEELEGRTAQADVSAVAELHRQVIQGGFLSSLGQAFLEGMYRTVITSPHAFLLVARESDGGIAGFICGCTSTRSLYREFALRGGLRVKLALVRRALSPSTLRRIAETVLYGVRGVSQDLPEPEILNFCVSPDRQGKGVGRELFSALIEEFRTRQVPRIRIVTGAEQVSAQRFYDAAGATRVLEFELHRDVRSVALTYEIPPKQH